MADLRFTTEVMNRLIALEEKAASEVTPAHLDALETKINTGLATAEAKVNSLVAALNAPPATGNQQ